MRLAVRTRSRTVDPLWQGRLSRITASHALLRTTGSTAAEFYSEASDVPSEPDGWAACFGALRISVNSCRTAETRSRLFSYSSIAIVQLRPYLHHAFSLRYCICLKLSRNGIDCTCRLCRGRAQICLGRRVIEASQAGRIQVPPRRPRCQSSPDFNTLHQRPRRPHHPAEDHGVVGKRDRLPLRVIAHELPASVLAPHRPLPAVSKTWSAQASSATEHYAVPAECHTQLNCRSAE